MSARRSSTNKGSRKESVDYSGYGPAVASSHRKNSGVAASDPTTTSKDDNRPDHISKARSYEEFKAMLVYMLLKEQKKYFKEVENENKQYEVDIPVMDPWEVMAEASIFEKERAKMEKEGERQRG